MEQSIQVTAEQLNNAEALLANKEAEITELRKQLIQGESQFQNAVEEHQEVLANMELLKSRLESESKKNTELTMQITAIENSMLKRELELANLKAELYQRINSLQSEASNPINESESSAKAMKTNSRLPVFECKSLTFNRWINGVLEIFENYPALKDFQKRALVLESLNGPAREWYDAEPDSNVANFQIFKDSLIRQYGSAESTDQALERIDTLKLTMKSDFNSFIQQIRPSIKLIAGDNNTLAIAMLGKQVDPEIRKYVPKIVNESFESHEQRLKAHMQDSQGKFTTASNRSNGMEIDTYSAAVQTANDYSISADQYSSNRGRPQPSSYFQKNPFRRST
ncbi:hypothetical protein AYI68_g7711 [Smittium mucronatum]|uniref:Retrotransposon gag domain-containing protein n=1 Tax=Smittium mucronatum TaxID=133383 RepID=A0A1R0GMY2_9FUNG|nr:hypothetical protein AYI68_g7711 [Smittium mucronatum]